MLANTSMASTVITGRYYRGKIELTRKVKLVEGTMVRVAIPKNGKSAKQRKKIWRVSAG